CTILVKITAGSIVSPNTAARGSHDNRRMVRFRNADALSADDCTGEVDRLPALRQCQAPRPRLLCRRPDRLARAGRASERHRGVSVLRGGGAAGGIPRRPAAPDRRTGGLVPDRADRLCLHLSRQPADAALDPVEPRLCDQHRDLLHAADPGILAGVICDSCKNEMTNARYATSEMDPSRTSAANSAVMQHTSLN